MREGQVDKRYRVLLKGRWRGGGRRVEAPLARTRDGSGERRMRVRASGAPSATAFTPIAQDDRASFMEARLITGRTHQIRVHAATVLDMPVAGDPRYGDDAFNAAMRELGLGRMFLHASRLTFPHPASGDTVRVHAPLPAALSSLLASLDLNVDHSHE